MYKTIVLGSALFLAGAAVLAWDAQATAEEVKTMAFGALLLGVFAFVPLERRPHRVMEKARSLGLDVERWGARSPAELTAGLDRIRNWRRLRPLAWIGAFPAGHAAEALGAPGDWPVLVALGLVMLFEARVLMLSCPRCRMPFHSRFSMLFADACCGCGLSLDRDGKRFFW